MLVIPTAVLAQQDEPQDGAPQDEQHAPRDRDDILVTTKRLPGSALGDIAPVAVLDAASIQALGVTNLDDMLRLLKPLVTAASGAGPVFLLNGRRVSGYGEIQTLPPEALERTEVLPETDAPRFGFPSTVRLVNFITKRHFRALSVEQGRGPPPRAAPRPARWRSAPPGSTAASDRR